MRHIGSLGLKSNYSDDDEILKKWIKRIFSLAMVPIEAIDSLWEDILIDKPELPRVDEFLDYFTNTYFEGQFPVELWNHFKTVGPRTNNHLEGYNSKLKKCVSVAHPNIYTAIQLLQSQEVSASLNFYRAANGERIPPRRKKDIEKDIKFKENV